MKLSEKDFQKQVIEIGHLYHWKIAHFRTSMSQSGKYLTACQADAAGFPDLVMVRDRVIWAELKSDKGKISDAQRVWIDDLKQAGQECYIWKPSDFDEIVEILS